MASKELEFRGIPLHHLRMYFEELGAVNKTLGNSLPNRFEKNGWNAEIISERTLAFTANFKVNAVKIRFEAADTESLQDLITNYRYKTTRVGG